MGKVVHFEIPFDDKKRAMKFYADAFDWRLTLGADSASGRLTLGGQCGGGAANALPPNTLPRRGTCVSGTSKPRSRNGRSSCA
jgi:predicted enzyme related to lactoylglutathione lyase